MREVSFRLLLLALLNGPRTDQHPPSLHPAKGKSGSSPMGEAYGKRTKRNGTCNVPSKLNRCLEERSHEPCEVSTDPRCTDEKHS